jgi:uracil-DNA glycosylase
VLGSELIQPYFTTLSEFVDAERERFEVYPPERDVFNAYKFTPYDKVRVVLLGQDPYHDEGQAHGLCFSVRPGVRKPPSLINILKEFHSDVGCPIPNHGCLESWARQGVFMLNVVLTVRAHRANSHKGKGWEKFTDATIRALAAKPDPVVFLLWGAPAQKKVAHIGAGKHVVIQSAHPSPLSARRGFLGSRPFSKANNALKKIGKPPLDWCIPDSIAESRKDR